MPEEERKLATFVLEIKAVGCCIMKFTAEQIAKAAECTELQTLAKNEGIELTDAEAENYFLAIKEGANTETLKGIAEGDELDDEALNKVAGGKCDKYSCSWACNVDCPDD